MILMQCGFIALTRAVAAFDPASGYKLITYLNFPIRNVFREALGIFTSRRDLLAQCVSLDEPLPGADDLTLEDMVPDPAAEDDMARPLESAYQAELHAALEKGLSELPAGDSEFLRLRYYRDMRRRDIAAATGKAPLDVTRGLQRGIHAMRAARRRQYYAAFRENIISVHGYRHTGLSAFEQWRGSSVERMAEILAIRRRYFEQVNAITRRRRKFIRKYSNE